MNEKRGEKMKMKSEMGQAVQLGGEKVRLTSLREGMGRWGELRSYD